MICKGYVHLYQTCKNYIAIEVRIGKNMEITTYWSLTDTKKYYITWHKKSIALMRRLKINGCAICGYNKCDGSLDFHHSNPKDKKYNINLYRITNKDLVDELNKCILLCKNCHGEIETLERKNAM